MIPEFQTLMLPILKLASDGLIHTMQETIESLAKQLELTEEDLNEWLSSKSQKKFYNYVYWAKAHLKMAGALENKARGQFQITNRGLEILSENPALINIKYLTNKYSDYKSLMTGNKKSPDKTQHSNKYRSLNRRFIPKPNSGRTDRIRLSKNSVVFTY